MALPYRPDIDGLRAVAVVPVILFHAGVTGFAGGYVGVDVFFVISGYLITTILVQDLQAGRFSLGRFYERRARRLLPALSVMMLCCMPFAWMWMLPAELAAFGKSLISTSLFVSNILFWRESGYFDPASELKPLLHTWSLAVEEQYYLVFPLLLALFWRRARAAIMPVLLLVTLASLAIAEWGAHNSPSANFYLLPSRIWELLIGAIVALRGARSNNALSLAGLIAVLAALVLFDAQTPAPGLWMLLPVAGAALVLGYGGNGTIAGRILAWRPLVGIGLISYSLYLWHQPLLAFARIRTIGHPGPMLTAALIAATFLLAWASWRFVERPFRGSRPLLPAGRQMAGFALVSILGFSLAGAALYRQDGLPGRMAPAGIPFTAIADLGARLAPNPGLDAACDAGGFTLDPACRTAPSPTVALWGDSYAMHLVQALRSSATAPDFIQLTLSQCGPFPDLAINGSFTGWRSCLQFNAQALTTILASETIRTVVISSPFNQTDWPLYRADGSVIYGRASREAALRDSIAGLAQQLAARSKRLVIVAPPPGNGTDLGMCSLRGMAMGLPPDRCDFSVSSWQAAAASRIALIRSLEAHAPVIRLSDHTCDAATCHTTIGPEALYRDAGHLSVRGSAAFGQAHDLGGLIARAAAP